MLSNCQQLGEALNLNTVNIIELKCYEDDIILTLLPLLKGTLIIIGHPEWTFKEADLFLKYILGATGMGCSSFWLMLPSHIPAFQRRTSFNWCWHFAETQSNTEVFCAVLPLENIRDKDIASYVLCGCFNLWFPVSSFDHTFISIHEQVLQPTELYYLTMKRWDHEVFIKDLGAEKHYELPSLWMILSYSR